MKLNLPSSQQGDVAGVEICYLPKGSSSLWQCSSLGKLLTSPSGGSPTWDDHDIYDMWSKSKVYWWPKVKIINPIILSLWSPAWHKCVTEGGRRRKVSHLSETDVKVWPEYDHDCDDDLDHIDNDGHKKDGDMFPIWVKQMSRFGLSLIMIMILLMRVTIIMIILTMMVIKRMVTSAGHL